MGTYILRNGVQEGPFTDEAIIEALNEHVLSYDDLSWKEGMPEWQPLRCLYQQKGSQPPPPPIPKKQKKGLAIASLTCGIIGGWLSTLSIAAIICGHIALHKIKKNPMTHSGKGMAIAGLVLGYLGLSLAIAIGIVRGILSVRLSELGY
jgi:hypothetical protein